MTLLCPCSRFILTTLSASRHFAPDCENRQGEYTPEIDADRQGVAAGQLCLDRDGGLS
jgi:hypothetical protein